MQAHEFFIEDENAPADGWGVARPTFNTDLMAQLVRGPVPGDDDLATAISLARLTHEQYQAYGTNGSQEFTDEDSRVALRALRLVLERHGVEFRPPWRDFGSFRSHWIAVGASGTGGWQARRDLLAQWWDPVLETLERAEEAGFRAELAQAVSPRTKTGWDRVDDEIAQLRLRFRSAATTQDYRDVGNRCVGVLEALSAAVYVAAQHCPAGQQEPPVDKTDIRIGAYVSERLAGGQNEELRGLTKKASALAHKVKHSPRADRTSAGIAADAVILLANILRRLAESPASVGNR